MKFYDINIRIVFGVIDNGIGYIYVNGFFLILNVLIINKIVYKSWEWEVGKVIEEVVINLC